MYVFAGFAKDILQCVKFGAQENKRIERLCNKLDVCAFLTTGIAIILPTIIFDWPFGTNIQHKDFMSSGLWAIIFAVPLVGQNNVCTKYWPMGYYLEETCHTIAHGPLLDWATGRKAPVSCFCKPLSNIPDILNAFKMLV